MTATQTAPRQDEEAAELTTDRLKAFITTRLRRNEMPAQIAAAVRGYFGIAFEPAQVIPFWRGELTLPIETGRSEDKESQQIPADAAQEPLLSRAADGDAPVPIPFTITPEPDPLFDDAEGDDAPTDDAPEEDAPATQTGRRQDEEESLQVPLDRADEGEGASGRHAKIEALGALVKAKLGIAPDPASATQTGRRQGQRKSVLTDEMKTFIVKGLARFETPSRVAASVQAEFGIAIDRRQVFAYDPAGARPPAQRWIDLHAATRAQFLRATAEIGIAHKLVRLRMLDRYANRADENNQMERAAAFLVQVARECGGFYERYQRPNGAPPPAGR